VRFAVTEGLNVPSAVPLPPIVVTRRNHDRRRAIAVVEHIADQPAAEGRFLRGPYQYWPRMSGPQRDAPPSERPDDAKRVVPIRPRPQPRPARPTEDDDPPPNRAA
jgi:hypothetical protein